MPSPSYVRLRMAEGILRGRLRLSGRSSAAPFFDEGGLAAASAGGGRGEGARWRGPAEGGGGGYGGAPRNMSGGGACERHAPNTGTARVEQGVRRRQSGSENLAQWVSCTLQGRHLSS